MKNVAPATNEQEEASEKMDELKEKTNRKKRKRKRVKKINLLSQLPENKEEQATFDEILSSKRLLTQFKNYVQNHEGRDILNKLMAYSDIASYFDATGDEKTKKSALLFRTYFDETSRRSVALPDEIKDCLSDRPHSAVFQSVKEFLIPDLEECCEGFNKFQATKSEKDETVDEPTDASTEDLSEFGGNQELIFKGRRRKNKIIPTVIPSKEDKMSFLRAIQHSHGKPSLEINLFRFYLVHEAEWEGFSRLEKDLDFFMEVQKFKEMYPFLDETSLTRKAEVIVDVFIDSATPPWLQIDIPSDLASKISSHVQQCFSSVQKMQKDQRDPSIFDDAQAIVLKELVPFWAEFRRKNQALDTSVLEKPTRFAECQRKRLSAFIKHPISKYNFLVDDKPISKKNNRRSDVNEMVHFSMSDGFRWTAALPPLKSTKTK